MNWYLFALYCTVLIALLMAFGALCYSAAKYAANVNSAEDICEKVVGRIIRTIGDETRDITDYMLDESKKMVEDTFKANEES